MLIAAKMSAIPTIKRRPLFRSIRAMPPFTVPSAVKSAAKRLKAPSRKVPTGEPPVAASLIFSGIVGTGLTGLLA